MRLLEFMRKSPVLSAFIIVVIGQVLIEVVKIICN